MAVRINIELDSLEQANAIEAALEIFVDLEQSRSDGDPGFTAADAYQLEAARAALGKLNPRTRANHK
jgi:hypothetical protein